MKSPSFFLIAFLLVCCAPTPPPPTAEAVKVFIQEPGMYRVSRSDLQTMGFRVDAGNLAKVHLTHRGQELPMETQIKGDAYQILFYARPETSIYSRDDIYWLTTGSRPGERIATRTAQPIQGAPTPVSFPATLDLKQDQIYLPDGVGDEHWFWQSLTAPMVQTITVSSVLSAVTPSNTQIEIALAGETTGAHQVQVSLNGQTLGEAQWEGRTTQVLQANTMALRDRDNAIALRVVGAPDRVEVDLLSSITITYPHPYLANDDALEFVASGDVRLSGFTGPAAVYDITDPEAVQKLDGPTTVREGDASSLAFNGGTAERRYLAIAPTAFKTPPAMHPARANQLRMTDQQADYIVIAPAEFSDALQPLLKYRSAQGLKAQLVDVEQIYDAFSDGVPDPHALRDFIQYTLVKWARPAPRFVLLVGKASYDYRDNLGGPNKNLVPTFLVPTPHLGEAASDNWFAESSEADPHPVLAIGRIPAKTPAQVTIAVNKLLAYEAVPRDSDWRARAVFVADDKETDFDTSSDLLAENLPDAIKPDKIYLSDYHGDLEATRAEIIHQWNAGTLLMTYIGHGSIDTWAMGPLFSGANVDSLANNARLPILLTPTCLDGYFYHPSKDSLAESLLFKEGGGIVAGLVPTGLSLPGAQDVLMKALFGELFAHPSATLGEAILRAKQSVPADSDDVREVLETFTLLGDPALKWEPP